MDRAYGSPERVALGSSLGSSLGGYASRSTVSRPGVHSPGSPSPVSPHPAHPSPPAGRQNGSDTLELKLRIQQLRKTIDSSSSATRLSPSPGRAGSATHGGLLQSPPAADSASDREQLIKETERRRLLEIEKERIRGQQVDKLKNALETLREESSRDRAEAARVIKSLEADVRRAKSQSASPRREPSASADTREEEMQRTIASLRRELAQSDSHIKHLEEERTRDAQNAVVLQAGQDEAAAKTRSLQLDWEKERFALTEQMKDMREELSILKGEHARLEGSCEDRARQVEMETDGLKAALRASEEENSTERSQHAKTVEFLKAELQRMEDTVQEERSFSNGLRKELAERVERQVEHHEVELKQYDSPAREQTPEAEEKGGGGAVTPVKSDDKTVEADIVESVVQREEEEVPEMKEKVQIEEKPAKGEKKTVKANKAGAVMTGMVIILPILLVASLVLAGVSISCETGSFIETFGEEQRETCTSLREGALVVRDGLRSGWDQVEGVVGDLSWVYEAVRDGVNEGRNYVAAALSLEPGADTDALTSFVATAVLVVCLLPLIAFVFLSSALPILILLAGYVTLYPSETLSFYTAQIAGIQSILNTAGLA